jgi:hypothetical protein
MKCRIIKRLVSSAANGRRDLSRPVRRHLERCSACREFARFSLALSQTAARDARALLERIPAPETAGLLEKSPAPTGSARSVRRFSRRTWIPASVGASGLILAALLVFRPAPIFKESVSPDEVAEFKKIAFSGGTLVNAAIEAPSPLDQEYKSLKKAVDSAVQTLLDSLDFKVKLSGDDI